MKKIKEFNVSKKKRPYIINVLKRRGIDYEVISEEKIKTELSGNQFHQIVLRATMEQESPPGVMLVHSKEKQTEVLQNEMLENQKNGIIYFIIPKGERFE